MTHPCPCCRSLTLEQEPPGSCEVCPVCFWEDDAVQFREPHYAGGANTVSLGQARANFIAIGASEARFLSQVRRAHADEVPARFDLSFASMHRDGPSLDTLSERLLRIVADLRVAIDGRTLYAECDIPVVELASQLWGWMEGGDTRGDFSYESMESEVPGLILIERSADGWRLGSVHQSHEEVRAWPGEYVDSVLRAFIAQVIAEAREQFDVDVRSVIETPELRTRSESRHER